VNLCFLKTTAANGNRGLSILISVLGALLSIFTVPPMLVWLIPILQDIHIDASKVLLGIVIRILLPLLVSKAVFQFLHFCIISANVSFVCLKTEGKYYTHT
jgi:predicted Na+-dependent transporter